MKPKIDRKLKRIYEMAQQYIKGKQSKGFPRIRNYYRSIFDNADKNWDELQQIFQKEIMRIKKSENTWNYTDICIVKNCIIKSMHCQVMAILIKKWCGNLQIQLLQPFSSLQSNNPQIQYLNKQQKIDFIRDQIRVFCEYLFKCAYSIYGILFIRYYKNSGNQSTKQEIYDKQRYIFQDFIRNNLTNSKYLLSIYHKYFMTIMGSNCKIPQFLIKQQQENLNNFIHFKLQIKQQHKFNQVYQETSQAMWIFHSQVSLIEKIKLGPKILSSIDQDHMNYYKKHHIKVVKHQQPLTIVLLNLLFKVYIPNIEGTFNYIKMLLEYRSQFCSKSIGELYDKIQEFYLYWLNQEQAPKFTIILQGHYNICFSKQGQFFKLY